MNRIQVFAKIRDVLKGTLGHLILLACVSLYILSYFKFLKVVCNEIAIQLFKILIRMEYCHWQSSKQIARCYLSLGRDQLAVETLMTGIERSPGNRTLNHLLGTTLSQLSDDEKGIVVFRELYDRFGCTSSLLWISYFLEKQGRFQEAILQLKRIPKGDKNKLEAVRRLKKLKSEFG